MAGVPGQRTCPPSPAWGWLRICCASRDLPKPSAWVSLANLGSGRAGAVVTGARARRRLPHQASVAGLGVKVDAFLLELDLCGVAASSGSACAGLTGEPSHVLRAIGCDPVTAEGSVAFTLGRWTTSGEIDYVLDILPVVVDRLRRHAS